MEQLLEENIIMYFRSGVYVLVEKDHCCKMYTKIVLLVTRPGTFLDWG